MCALRVVLVCFAACLLPLACADVDFTKPAAGDVISGTSLVAAWTESGQKPAISTLESYSLFLCAGGNNETDFIQLFNLQPYATYGEGNKWTGAISTGWGGNSTDAYFLLMVSTSACGGTIKNYSKRFTISSMAGSFPPNVVQGIQTIGSDTSGPSTDQSDAGPALTCTASVAAEPAAASSRSSASSVSLSPSSTSTSTAGGLAPTSLPSSSKSVSLSPGALGGVIVISILVFLTIAAVALFIFRRIRRQRLQSQSPKSSLKSWLNGNKKLEMLGSRHQYAELSETPICKEMEGDKRQPLELSTMVRAELPARRSIYELPGS